MVQWFLGQGALEAEAPIYMVVLMISSLLSIGYLMPVVARAYFEHQLKEMQAPLLCVIPPPSQLLAAFSSFPTPLRDLLLPILGEVTDEYPIPTSQTTPTGLGGLHRLAGHPNILGSRWQPYFLLSLTFVLF